MGSILYLLVGIQKFHDREIVKWSGNFFDSMHFLTDFQCRKTESINFTLLFIIYLSDNLCFRLVISKAHLPALLKICKMSPALFKIYKIHPAL